MTVVSLQRKENPGSGSNTNGIIHETMNQNLSKSRFYQVYKESETIQVPSHCEYR
jgi:hypothetical protein